MFLVFAAADSNGPQKGAKIPGLTNFADAILLPNLEDELAASPVASVSTSTISPLLSLLADVST